MTRRGKIENRELAMKSIGVDIVEVERIEKSVARFGEHFLRRIYTDQELAYCQGRANSLAARWAAKEAVAKALGTGIGNVTWLDIEVVCDVSGRPSLQLHRTAAQKAAELGLETWLLSLSHTESTAIAFVVAG